MADVEGFGVAGAWDCPDLNNRDRAGESMEKALDRVS